MVNFDIGKTKFSINNGLIHKRLKPICIGEATI